MKVIKRSTVIILILMLIQNLGFASDFSSIYDELKSDYPQIITTLKSEGATDSDIQMFLNDLSNQIGSTANLTTSNFDAAMYAALKNVLFVNGEVGVAKSQYLELAMAILNNYASTYTSGTLTGDMLSLRNVVMNAILGSDSSGGGMPVVGLPTITETENTIATKVSTDLIGEFLELDQTSVQDIISTYTSGKLKLVLDDIDLTSQKRISLQSVKSLLEGASFIDIEMPSVSLQVEKDDTNEILDKTLNVSYDQNAFNFDWEETSSVSKDLNKPIQVKLAYEADIDENTIAVFRELEDGTLIAEGGYYDGENIYFLADKPGKYIIQENVKTFDDFSISDYWASNKVNRLASMGIIGGKSEGVYDPSAPISRAEFATLMVKMLKYDNLDPEATFDDVSDDKWYATNVKLALTYGLMSGKGNNTFDPDGNITQQEILIVLSKILQGREVEEGAEESQSSITYKTSSASTWASGYIENAISNGALNGMPISNVDMQKDATRLETANMLYEILNELYED